jgi:Transposase DDE domain
LPIDASDLTAYANGQRYLSKNGPERKRYSDPDASWGHRSAVSTRKGGGFYGYRVHAAVCARTGLPLAWQVRSGREHESLFVAALLDTLRRRGFQPETAALDMGYDNNRVYAECEERDCAPVIPLRRTPEVARGNHGAPTCEHGTWTFAGATSRTGVPSGAARLASAPPSPLG